MVYVVNRKLTFYTNKTKQNAHRLFFDSLRSMAVLVGRAKIKAGEGRETARTAMLRRLVFLSPARQR